MGNNNNLYHGNIPDDIHNFKKLERKFFDTENSGNWILFVSRFKKSDTWINFKLVFDGYAKRKANFRFGFNRLEKRICKGKDPNILFKYNQNLFNDIIDHLSSIDWMDEIKVLWDHKEK